MKVTMISIFVRMLGMVKTKKKTNKKSEGTKNLLKNWDNPDNDKIKNS